MGGASVSRFLEQKLRLKVNREKSAVGRPVERKFLGFRLWGKGATVRLDIAPRSLERFRATIRRLTRRMRGKKLADVLVELRRRTDLRAVVLASTGKVFSAGGDFELIRAELQEARFAY